MLNWRNDIETLQFVSENLPQVFLNFNEPTAQYPGREINILQWQSKVLDINQFPQTNMSSPENIINCFQNGNYLNGLVLVVSWGTMWRQNKKIYNVPLHEISNSIQTCTEIINNERNIENAWRLLSINLNWSNVIISKLLHFLSRSLSFKVNCPVPIDNAVMLKRVWPELINNFSRNERPGNWKNSLEGYLRYMTFINYLRENCYHNWTNIQIESTLFSMFRWTTAAP